MAVPEQVSITPPNDIQTMRQELHKNVYRSAIPALILSGLFVSGLAAEAIPLDQGLLLAFFLWALAATVWFLEKWHHLISAWTLVCGCAAFVLLMTFWADVTSAIHLLILPASLATLLVSNAGGLLLAALLTVLLSSTILPGIAGEACAVAILSIWLTVALTWLASHSLLTALQWSLVSYTRSRELLDKARDSQMHLKTALADLLDANTQLARLNQLAQGLRQAAEDAERVKAQFVANVSHELRMPLNMILGFSQMIIDSPQAYSAPIPQELLADLEVICRNAKHLSKLIDDVLDLSQLEAKKMALTKERVDLRAIIEDAILAVQPLFDSKGLYLKIHLQQDLPLVFCDPTRIREVILNLVSNAGRFTKVGGVTISAWSKQSDIVVSVADTGPGIAASDRKRIFQTFEQLDPSIGRRHGGAGLGLAISRSFVRLHNGEMWLESEEGRGATFSFRLPIDPPLPLATSAARWLHPTWDYYRRDGRPIMQADPARPCLVVLEHGGSFQHLLSRYLDGAEVVATNDPQEAIAALARTPCQALLINAHTIPDEIQRLITTGEIPYDTPIIRCSLPDAQTSATSMGASSYLVKPVSRDILLDALEEVSPKAETVLIIDDEPEALRLLWRMLSSGEKGYRVFTAANGQEGLNVMRRQHPHVILLDLIMPNMDGFHFLNTVSEDPNLRRTPVIIISAKDPLGHPIVSDTIQISRQSGFAIPQLLTFVESVIGSLGPARPADGPA